MGDHIYRRREIDPVLLRSSQIVKPANFPSQAPGKDWTVVTTENGVQVAVISLLGRLFMRPVDCPWTRADEVLDEIPKDVPIRIVDFHAEATSEKQLMGRYLDGRVSAVLGTHTHVTTADEQILPGGSAFQCDVGMTGAHESILGRDIQKVMHTTITFRPTFFQVAKGDARISGTIVTVDRSTGKATDIRRLVVREEEAETLETL
jgi:metallophosphoesterase (TIGR00282 family)